MHSQQPPGVVQNWSTLQCSKQNTEQCGYDHAPVTRGRMRAQFPLPHGPPQFPSPFSPIPPHFPRYWVHYRHIAGYITYWGAYWVAY